jgi:hypothetical protein
VTIWSYCNEAGCADVGGGASAWHDLAYHYDGTRPTLGNDVKNKALNKYMDVQGELVGISKCW